MHQVFIWLSICLLSSVGLGESLDKLFYPHEAGNVSVSWNEELHEFHTNVPFRSYYFLLPGSNRDIDSISYLMNTPKYKFEIAVDPLSSKMPYHFMSLLRFVFGFKADEFTSLFWSRLRNAYTNTYALTVENELKVLNTVKQRMLSRSELYPIYEAELVQLSLAASYGTVFLQYMREHLSNTDAYDHFGAMTADQWDLLLVDYYGTVLNGTEMKSNSYFQHYLIDTLIPLIKQPNCCLLRNRNSDRHVLYEQGWQDDVFDKRMCHTKVEQKLLQGRELEIAKYAKVGVGNEDYVYVKRYLMCEKITCDGADVCNVTNKMDQSIIAMECSQCDDPVTGIKIACHCHKIPQMNNQYNNLIATVAMMLSPLAYSYTPLPTTSQMVSPDADGSSQRVEVQCSEHVVVPEMLILGLGGGELHSFLRRFFPCLGVTTVEISEAVIQAAVTYLDVEVCDIMNIAAQTSTRTNVTLDDGGNTGCRSRIIHGSALETIANIASDSGSPTDGHARPVSVLLESKLVYPKRYQYIISDIYGIEATNWNSGKGKGFSNPKREIIDSVRKMKAILDPETGLAMIYLHWDKTLLTVLEIMWQEFADVVVIGSTQNSRILLGSLIHPIVFHSSHGLNATGSALSHALGRRPCEDMLGMGEAVPEFAYHYYGQENHLMAHAYQYAVDCNIFDLLTEDDQADRIEL